MKAKEISLFELLSILMALATTLVAAIWWVSKVHEQVVELDRAQSRSQHEQQELVRKIDRLEDETAKLMGVVGL